MSEKFLDRIAAAAFLTEQGFRTAPRTLAKLACIGGGPVFHRFGRAAVYQPTDLLAWAESRLSQPMTSTSGAEG